MLLSHPQAPLVRIHGVLLLTHVRSHPVHPRLQSPYQHTQHEVNNTDILQQVHVRVPYSHTGPSRAEGGVSLLTHACSHPSINSCSTLLHKKAHPFASPSFLSVFSAHRPLSCVWAACPCSPTQPPCPCSAAPRTPQRSLPPRMSWLSGREQHRPLCLTARMPPWRWQCCRWVCGCAGSINSRSADELGSLPSSQSTRHEQWKASSSALRSALSPLPVCLCVFVGVY